GDRVVPGFRAHRVPCPRGDRHDRHALSVLPECRRRGPRLPGRPAARAHYLGAERAVPSAGRAGRCIAPRPGPASRAAQRAGPDVTALDTAARARLTVLVRQLAVVYGRVTVSSGAQADYYVDLRRVTLHHEAAPLIGRLVRELTADWSYQAVGGLTLGADPV